MPMSQRTRPHGFTMVEAAIVIAILVLLAGVLVPIVTSEIASSRGGRAQTELRAVADAFTRYHADTRSWPSNEPFDGQRSLSGELLGLPMLYSNTEARSGWAGPYLATGVKEGVGWRVARAVGGGEKAQGLVDPWSRAYRVYYFGRSSAMGEDGGIALVCVGKNGTLDSSLREIAEGTPASDDVVQIVTRRL